MLGGGLICSLAQFPYKAVPWAEDLWSAEPPRAQSTMAVYDSVPGLGSDFLF